MSRRVTVATAGWAVAAVAFVLPVSTSVLGISLDCGPAGVAYIRSVVEHLSAGAVGSGVQACGSAGFSRALVAVVVGLGGSVIAATLPGEPGETRRRSFRLSR